MSLEEFDIVPLTLDDIYVIHEEMLERYGGISGAREPGLIEYMTEKPFQETFGYILYPGLFLKAACYMEGFATHQYFNDGNKRTAYGCAALFLDYNGFTIIVDDEELFNMTMDVALRRVDVNELSKWLESVSVPSEYIE
ncbi:type II toxin-antitoxin system death-on-curing family toxin [Aneurinibacillus danicus]|uniref:Death-on-curing protein n=1 Tax=Aneurinibacillus danicus TaxID=267746 RepID=A0A511VAX9_9BACL|nr:type II toxin-antitoxin system death-on-curing family toxin [Aneurinibacillus danicus]GEN36097.1 death-on-curing protein [Aneurinibacillus danicus]